MHESLLGLHVFRIIALLKYQRTNFSRLVVVIKYVCAFTENRPPEHKKSMQGNRLTRFYVPRLEQMNYCLSSSVGVIVMQIPLDCLSRYFLTQEIKTWHSILHGDHRVTLKFLLNERTRLVFSTSFFYWSEDEDFGIHFFLSYNFNFVSILQQIFYRGCLFKKSWEVTISFLDELIEQTILVLWIQTLQGFSAIFNRKKYILCPFIKI